MSVEIIPLKEPRPLAGLAANLPALFLPDEKTVERFFGFFTANIDNRNTRRAYYKGADRSADWCGGRGISTLADVKPLHVATHIDGQKGELAKPSVKQQLAALCMLFDWLMVAHALKVKSAHAVRGRHAHRPARPCADCHDGLYLRAHQSRAAHETSALTSARDAGAGCA